MKGQKYECSYCYNGEFIRHQTKNNTARIETYIEPDDSFIVCIDHGKPKADYARIHFNFCPMCGRRLNKEAQSDSLKDSLEERQRNYSETLSLLKMHYEKFIQSKDERIERLEKELDESKSKNKVLQSGESLLSSINEYKKRDTPNEKYKKGKLIYAVIKTLINTKAELSAKELAEMLGTSTACVRKSLNVLIETRDVERKRYGKLYKYRLAEWVSVEYS